MRVIWSPLAAEQARDIAVYIALDKPMAAKRWVEEIFAAVDCLLDFSVSGRSVPEIKNENIREIVKGSHRIVYKIQEKKILILLVKSYRQRLKSNEIER